MTTAEYAPQPHLTSVPVEIRLKIYSYLLSDPYVSHLRSDGTLCSRYTTALFTVNQQISDEALAYFHSENAFVLVENHEAYFLATCRRAIPLLLPTSLQCFRNYALSVSIHSSNSRSAKKAYTSGRAIFSSRHLSNFVRLLNAEHAILRNTDTRTRIDLHYRTDAIEYRGNARVLKCVTEGIKGLRPIHNPKGGHLSIRVCGDLDPEGALEVQRSKLSSYTATTALVEGKLAKERGNALYKAGDYNAARGEYLISVYTFASFKDEYDHDPKLVHEFETLFINISTNSSLLETRQGRHQAAVAQARKALDMSLSRCVEDSAEQKAKYRFRLACALADNGQHPEAADELSIAVALAPENMSIKAKLKQVNTRLTRHQKRSDSRFRANLSRAFD
ncbi:hypothetical protein PVAG01_10545 [Phlyctema vagabunda]|uniref:Uncharacterized protein n=1 Tax=Phlyctema vagabunda TaxID=108571 RepID=A0ABR4P2L1_9HELO